MKTARPFLITTTTLLFHIGSLFLTGTEIPAAAHAHPVAVSMSAPIGELPPTAPAALPAADMTHGHAAISFAPVVPASDPTIAGMGSADAAIPVPLLSLSMPSADMMACSSSDAGLPGPCSRAGCSGRDDYCKSYVVFDFLGLTLYRHCTGELRERVVNPNRR